MTTPTVGRIVHYYPGTDSEAHSNGCGAADPVAAVVTRVWGENCVNLTALLDNGAPLARTSVMHTSVANFGDRRWDWLQIV